MITSTIRKPIALVAILMIAAGILGACTTGDDTERRATGANATSGAASSVAEPYVLRTLDPSFDATYRIEMDLLDGYAGDAGGNPVVFGTDDGQGISAWIVGNVYAEPCRWVGTLRNPPIGSSVDGLVAGLENQKNRTATAPREVTLDGYAGSYMELTVPARIDVTDCHQGEFRTWVDTTGGHRNLDPDQRDLLWIVNVDGTRLVIDAALGPNTTQQDRADRIQMVESIRIEPV